MLSIHKNNKHAQRAGPPADLLPTAGQRANTRQVDARSEHIRIVPGAGSAGTRPGRAGWIERLGDQNHAHIRVKGHTLISLVEPYSPLRVGEEVSVGLNNPLFFDDVGDRIVVGGSAGEELDGAAE
jgi:multiple sugar transport system ATP-binding protein